MTDAEVGEMLGMLSARYQSMPVDQLTITMWINSFAKVDSDKAFDAARYWCKQRPVPPKIVELQEMVYRLTLGKDHGRGIAWAAYAEHCRSMGREPTHAYFEAEIENVG